MFIDGSGNFIKWEFIEKLEKLQDTEGLHLGNKLRKAHINFFRQKMKVRLAVQLFSESVADALCYCVEELKLPEFVGCQATVHFIRIINNIFDILNCRSMRPHAFKKALCSKNIERTTIFINETINYLSSIKLEDSVLLINSKRKTGFVGLIFSLKSALNLYNELVIQKNVLLYLPLYKISQDHLELFFSSIRSKGGWNNNPTTQQFTAAYKRLLVRAETRADGIGNCIPLDDIPILVGSSKLTRSELNVNDNRYDSVQGQESLTLQSIWSDHEYIMNSNIISECSQQIVVYIAGFVVFKLQKTIKCEQCIVALQGNKENFLNSLISKKNRGGLSYPSKDVIKICTIAEHFLRINDNSLNKTGFINILKNKVMFDCIQIDCFVTLKEHALETSNNHIYFLVESVITKYLNIRIHFITKRRSEIANPIRNELTRLILFQGQ